MLADKRWKYAVAMKHPKTGETRTVVVQLTDAERQDALTNIGGTGGDDGPIVRGYAMRHAEKQNPGFWAGDAIARVVIH